MTGSSDGSMWFGFADEVVHYDGLHWRHYTTSAGVSFYPTNTLYATPDGTIYTGRKSGRAENAAKISRLDNQHWAPMPPWDNKTRWQLADHDIASATITPDGTIWIGSSFRAISVKTEQLTVYTTRAQKSTAKTAIPEAKIVLIPRKVLSIVRFVPFAISQDKDENMLFAVKDGLIRYSKAQPERKSVWEIFPVKQNKWNRLDLRIYQAKDGAIWIINSILRDKVRRLDPATKQWQVIDLEKHGGTSHNSSILETQDGTLWIGGQSRLHAWRDGQWIVYESSELNLSEGFIHLAESRDGDLWIGVRYGELFRVDYSNRRWLSYQGLHFQCETNDQTNWFIEENGKVVAYNVKTGEWLAYTTEDGLIDTPVALFTSRKGTLFVAGSHQNEAATAIFNGTGWKLQTHPLMGQGIEYRSIFESQDGSVWFGATLDANRCKNCTAGLARYTVTKDGKDEWHYILAPKVKQRVVGMAEKPAGILWYTRSNTLYRFDGESSTVVSELQQLSRNWTDDVYKGFDNSIWVIKAGEGLYRERDERWTHYSTKNGLASNTVAFLLSHNDGTVWAATDKGISRFDGTDWTPLAFPSQITVERHGGTLKYAKDNTLWINRGFREWYFRLFDVDAYIKAQTTKSFETIRYIGDSLAPQTSITRIKDKTLDWHSARFVWSGQDPWDSTPRQKLQYSYRLDRGEWSRFSENTTFAFASLEPGKHELLVRSRDLDFNVDTTPAQIQFSIVPPLWRRPWLLLSVLLFVSAGSFHLIYNYTNKNKKILRLNRRLGKAQKRIHRLDIDLIQSREDRAELISQIEVLSQVDIYIDFNNKTIYDKNKKEFTLSTLAKTRKNNMFEILEFIQRLEKDRIHLIEFGILMPDLFLKSISENDTHSFNTKGKFARTKYGINKTFRTNCGKELILRDEEEIHIYFKPPDSVSLIKSSSEDFTISRKEISQHDKTEVASFQAFDAFDYSRINKEIVIRSSINESRQLFEQAQETSDSDSRIEALEHAVDLDKGNYEALKQLIQHNIFKYADIYQLASNELKTKVDTYTEFLKSSLYYEKEKIDLQKTREQYREIYGIKIVPKSKLKAFKMLSQKSLRQIIKYEKDLLRDVLETLKSLVTELEKFRKYIDILENTMTFFEICVDKKMGAEVVATWIESPHLYNQLLQNINKKTDTIESEMKFLFMKTMVKLSFNEEKTDEHLIRKMIACIEWLRKKYNEQTQPQSSGDFINDLREFLVTMPQSDGEQISRCFHSIKEFTSDDISNFPENSNPE